MVVLAWVSLVASTASALLTVLIVLLSPEASAQVLALEFPLTALGEGAVSMVLPIAFAIIGVSAGMWPAFQGAKRGTMGACIGLASGALSFVVLGRSGFEYLF
jgi:hypothetical protein